MPSPEELLDGVADRDSFLEFVETLADEREKAEGLERRQPEKYCIDGALDWKNGDISHFLRAALEYFEKTQAHEPDEHPSWKMFAEFLYFGKIIE